MGQCIAPDRYNAHFVVQSGVVPKHARLRSYTQSWLERQADVERLKHAHAKSLSGATNLVQYWCNWYARRSSTAYDNIAVFADFVTSMLVAFAVQSLATSQLATLSANVVG